MTPLSRKGKPVATDPLNSDDDTVLQRIDSFSQSVESGFARLAEALARIEILLSRIDSRLEGVENLSVMLQADFETLLNRIRENFPEIDGNGFRF